MEHPLEFYMDVHFQDDSSVPLHALGEIAENLAGILKEYSIAYTESSHIHWNLSTLRLGSIGMGVIPDLREAELDAREVRRITHQLMSDARELESGGSPDDVLPGNSSVHWRKWMALLRTGGVTTFSFRADGDTAVITKDGAGSAATSLDRRKAFGTLRGTIKGVNFAGTNYCSLYRIEGGRALKCYFPDELERSVIDALKKRVDITGLLNTDTAGNVQSIRLTTPPRVLTDESRIPRIDDLVGIAPDLTEGLDTVEWVRRQRVE